LGDPRDTEPRAQASAVPRPSANHLDRFDLLAAGLLVALAAYVGVILLRAPRNVGEFHDDGLYLVTAKALADGQGYRHTHLPGNPYQTKYPILYPLLVSAIWRLFPAFPDNVAVIQVVNVALWAAGSWLAYLVLRRAWGLPWWLPASGVALAFGHAGTLGLLQTAMSESLYLLFSMGTLVVLQRTTRDPISAQVPRRALWCSVLAGLSAGGAYLTRTVGAAVAAVVLWELDWRRRWRSLAAAAVAMALAAGAWQAWRVYAGHANAANPAFAALAYDLDYTIWLPQSPGALARVIIHNLSAVIAEHYVLLFPIQVDSVAHALQERARGVMLLYAGMLFAAVLTLVGAAGVWNRRQLSLHVYLLAYLGLVLMWPFSPMRFLLPILPLLTTLFLAGCYRLVRGLVSLVQFVAASAPTSDAADGETEVLSRWSGARVGARVSSVVVSLFVFWLAYANLWQITVQPGRAKFAEDVRRREVLVDLLRSRTPPDAVICADMAGYVHLRTGRKVVPFLPWTNPLPFLYPDDRELGGCGRAVTRHEVRNIVDYASTSLVPYLRATGSTHLVPLDENSSYYGIAFADLRQRYPHYFRLLGTREGYSLYQVVLPPQ